MSPARKPIPGGIQMPDGPLIHTFLPGPEVVELPRDAFRVSHDGRRATLEAKDACLVNSFQFLGSDNVAARVSFKVAWAATGPAARRGRGAEVAPTDRGYALLGRERNGAFLT